MNMIPIDKINTDNPYLRKGTELERLKKSITAIGLINPLTIDKDNNLLAGSRRFEALKELGHSEVPVQIVDQNKLESELVSIDENLVRKPLSAMELETTLARGKEIYEQLFPEAKKTEIEPPTEAQKKEESSEDSEESDDSGKPDSYVKVVGERTGLSESAIKTAIRREVYSGPSVKKMRTQGELNSTQVNEIIKLEPENQEEILPYVVGKRVKDLKKIVKTAQKEGVKAAVEQAKTIKTQPREVTQLISYLKKCNKILGNTLLEGLAFEGADELEECLRTAQNQIAQYLDIAESDSDHSPGPVEGLESLQ